MEIYTNDIVLIEMGIPVLYVVSAGALLLSIGFIFFNGVSGTGKTNISLTIEVLVLVIYLTYTYLQVYVFGGDIVVTWTAEICYGSLLALFSYAYLKSNHWRTSRV